MGLRHFILAQPHPFLELYEGHIPGLIMINPYKKLRALRMSVSRKGSDGAPAIGRRTFLASGFMAAAAIIAAHAEKIDKNYVKGSKKLVARKAPTPPGVESRSDFLLRCVGCGACEDICQSEVITLSAIKHEGRQMLVPAMDFDSSYCRFDCVECTQVCTTSALRPLDISEKRVRPIGRAEICETNCRQYVNGVRCGLCANVCPKRAISIRADKNGRSRPVLESKLCIGCGRCVNVCPAKPYKAIVIEGL